MTPDDIRQADAQYNEGARVSATFKGHPAQLKAAVALFNLWPAIRRFLPTSLFIRRDRNENTRVPPLP